MGVGGCSNQSLPCLKGGGPTEGWWRDSCGVMSDSFPVTQCGEESPSQLRRQPPLGKGVKGKRIATPVCALARNDIVFCKGCGGKEHKKTKSPPAFAKDDALHRDTTLLRRPLTRTDLMKCRHTSALLRAYPSGPNACAALGPAAPEPCSPIRSAPAFTGPGSLWRPKMGYSFLHCHFIPGENSLDAIIFSITYYIILPGCFCQ